MFETTVSGHPAPDVTWLLGETKLKPSNQILMEKAGQKHRLVMRECCPQLAGVVTVEVRNSIGSKTSNATLAIKGDYQKILIDLSSGGQ